MNLPELKSKARQLQHLGFLRNDKEIMELVEILPSPIFYVFNPEKIDIYCQKALGYDSSGTIAGFLENKFGVETKDKIIDLFVKNK